MRNWKVKRMNGIDGSEQQNNQLRSARLKKHWTPEFVSAQVGVSRHTYRRWEAGAQMPRLSSLDALCKMFAMSPAELGFVHVYAHEHVPASPNARIEAAPSATDPLEAVAPAKVNDVEIASLLQQWTSDLASYWQRYMFGSQSELESLLPKYFMQLGAYALNAGPMQHEAASLASQAYQLHALLHLQLGDFVAARASATQSLIYAQLARDWNLYVASQIRLATVYSANKRIGAALSAYNDALLRINTNSQEISPMLHSWVFAGLAEIQATMGRDAEALQLLKLASAVFPAQPELDACYTYTYCDRSILYLYQGLVFLRLGQPRLAGEAFAQVEELRPAPPERMRADFLRYRAYTSFVLGNMIQSCVYLEAAARAAQAIASDLTFSEIYMLYEHLLAAWGQEPRVRALAMLFQK